MKAATRRRAEAKRHIAQEVIAGRRSLAEAIGRNGSRLREQ
jgi:hypothetical protein